MNRLGNDNYNRPKITKQDLISENSDELKHKLENWILIPEEYIDRLQCSTWVRYVSHKGLYRSGGVLIKNASPTYLVLLNTKLKKSWSVDLSKNYIFVENQEEKKKITMMKDKLYKLYQEGMLKVDDDQE